MVRPTGQSPNTFNEGVIFSKKMVRPKGFEPLASGSGNQRSIQLSYGRLIKLLRENDFTVALLMILSIPHNKASIYVLALYLIKHTP